MFSALANHSSVANRILAELALEERLMSFVFAIVEISRRCTTGILKSRLEIRNSRR